MTRKLDGAIEAIDQRVEKICEFLHETQGGEPVDPEALAEAVHDCSNVRQSMTSLRRVVDREISKT